MGLIRRTIKGIKRRRKKPVDLQEKHATYSKLLTSSLVVSAAGWISWSYILATIALIQYGNVDPLTTLSIEVCKTIIGTVIVYGTKALFENIAKYNGNEPPTDETPSDLNEYMYEGEG